MSSAEEPDLETMIAKHVAARGGVLFSHRQVERKVATDAVLSTGTIREIRINPPFAPQRFSPS